MIRRPPRSTQSRSSAASDVYKRQSKGLNNKDGETHDAQQQFIFDRDGMRIAERFQCLSLIHISEPTRLLSISYAVFCLKKKKKTLNLYHEVRTSPEKDSTDHKLNSINNMNNNDTHNT